MPPRADADAKGPDRLDATDRRRLGEFAHRQDARSRIERGRQPLASSTRRRPGDLLGRPNLQEQERKDKALLLSFPTSFIGNPAVWFVPPPATITACGFPLKTAGMTEGGAGRPKGGAGRPKGGGNSLIPRHRALIGAPDAILPPARVAPKLVRLHSILRRRDVGTLHVSPASRPRTRDGFTLQGFDKRLRSRHRSPLPRVGQPFPRPRPTFYEN